MRKKSATKRRDGRFMTYAVLSSGRKPVYGKTEDEAVENAVALENQEKEYIDKTKFTFSNVFRHWLLFKLKQIKPQSVDRIEITYNKYFRDKPISNMDVRLIDTLFCVNWFLNLLNEHSMNYKEYQRIMQLFEGVCNFSVDYFGADENINFERVKRNIPRSKFVVTKRKEYAVSERSVVDIADSIVNSFNDIYRPSASALLYCNFYLGLRIGELASLKWSDIDFENGILYVRSSETKFHERDENGFRTGRMIYNRDSDTKTSAGNRSIILVDEAICIFNMIKEYQSSKGFLSVYVAYDGYEPLDMSRSIDRTLRRLERDLDLPTFNSHKIRKTLASKLHEGGISSREIADILGHTDISTTERNYIVSLEKNYEIIRQHLESTLKFKKENQEK